MSSAAKLRKYGRGTAVVAASALVMTSFGPAAFAWDDPNPSQTTPATSQAETVTGSIGVVDTAAAIDNQGATLIMPGQNDQAIGDVRITLPNRFKSGDRITLRLYDRSATETSSGNSNLDAAHLVGFSGDPKVTVGAVQNDDTVVSADTDAAATPNTETAPANPWVPENSPATPLTDGDDVPPGNGPTFNVVTQQDARVQGKNEIVLQVTNASVGDQNAKWVVTLSDLKVNLGASVTPGDLRLVPFASNAAANPVDRLSDWFAANEPEEFDIAANSQVINTYTVPAMVSPVRISSEINNIVADGNPQTVGKISATETVAVALGDGTYQLNVGGAEVVNEDLTDIKVTVANGGSSETVQAASVQLLGANGTPYPTRAAATAAGTTVTGVQFTLSGADDAKTSTIGVEGLLLSTTTPGTLEFSMTGGTISGGNGTWLAPYAGDSTLAVGGIPAAAAFSAGGDVNQTDILAPTDELIQTGVAVASTSRIGGNNRYETARKLIAARNGGDLYAKEGVVILASGENFPDALSSSYLSQEMNAPILLTMRDRIPSDTLEALRDHQVDKVYIIGGEAAVSPEVAAQLRGLKSYIREGGNLKEGTENLQVVRLGGTTRYTTNQLVNMYAAAWDGNATVGKTVYKYGEAAKYTGIIARGDNFPDALAAGVLTAGMKGGGGGGALPLILTQPDELSESAAEQIQRLDISHALIVGSESAVSNDVKTKIEDMGATDTRLGGPDRYFTAAAVAEFAMRDTDIRAANTYPGLGFMNYTNGVPASVNQIDAAYLANGLKFPDALVAGPWIGANSDVLNLTMGAAALSDGTKDFLTKRAADVNKAVALGLGDTVSTAVLNEANRIVSVK